MNGPGCFVIQNIGVEAQGTNQELILLVEMLKTGEPPDAVIFYDGVNDAIAAASPGTPGAHLEFNFIKGRVEGSLASRFDFLRESNSLHIAS